MSLFGGDAETDCAAEATIVDDVILQHGPNASFCIEFRCRSARHAVEFARAGFSITGLDRMPWSRASKS